MSSCAQLRRRDKITRGACARNDDKVIFENALNWITRSFIFAKQGEYEHGRPTHPLLFFWLNRSSRNNL